MGINIDSYNEIIKSIEKRICFIQQNEIQKINQVSKETLFLVEEIVFLNNLKCDILKLKILD